MARRRTDELLERRAPRLGELRIQVADRASDPGAIEAKSQALAKELNARAHPVREIRIPPPGMHPHQRQMTTVLVLLLAFSAMALMLSAILVATSLAAMLARQVREIGVMKTIGARTDQIVGMYAVLVAVIGLVVVLLSQPFAILGRVCSQGRWRRC